MRKKHRFKRSRPVSRKYARKLRPHWLSPRHPQSIQQTRRLCAYRLSHPIHSKSQKRKTQV